MAVGMAAGWSGSEAARPSENYTQAGV
jgi:hypothetical protein